LLRLLDDGMSTPLHYRVCDRKGLAYQVNAGLDPLGDTSLVEISAACGTEKLPELVGEILSILSELRDKPVSADRARQGQASLRPRSGGGFRRRRGAVRLVWGQHALRPPAAQSGPSATGAWPG
jgi:predicted Zn-dependent peptidase